MPNQQPLLYPLKIASIYHWRQHSVPVLRVKKNIKKDMIFYTRSIPLTLALQNNLLSTIFLRRRTKIRDEKRSWYLFVDKISYKLDQWILVNKVIEFFLYPPINFG